MDINYLLGKFAFVDIEDCYILALRLVSDVGLMMTKVVVVSVLKFADPTADGGVLGRV